MSFKKLTVLLTSLVLNAAFIFNAQASEYTLSFNRDTGIANVEGQFPVSNKLVTIQILKPGYTSEDIEMSDIGAAFDMMEYIAQSKTDSDGRFSFSWLPGEDGGSYAVYLCCESGIDESDNLTVYSKSEVEEALAKINNAYESGSLMNIFESCRDILGLTISGYSEMSDVQKDYIFASVLKLKKDGFNSVSQLQEALTEAAGLSELKVALSEGRFEEYIASDESVADISENCDFYEIYNSQALTDICKNNMYVALASDDFASVQEFYEVFDEYTVLYGCWQNRSWANVKNILESDLLQNRFTLTTYNDFDEKQKACQFINGSAKPFENIQALVDAVNEYCDSYTQESTSSSRPSGGGGSSVSVKPSPSISSPVSGNQPSQTETDKKVPMFTDMSGYEWANDYVSKLALAGIVSGRENNIYDPAAFVTREEFAKMLVGAMSLEAGGEVPFVDVDKNSWYCGYVASAFRAGIISGINNTEFGTGREITRQDASLMIYRALKNAGEAFENGSVVFEDNDKIAGYATEAVAALANNGIISGRGNNAFAPVEFINRAEAAKLIYAVYERRNGNE